MWVVNMAQVRDDGREVVEKRQSYDKNQMIQQPIKNRDYKTTSKQSTCRILNGWEKGLG